VGAKLLGAVFLAGGAFLLWNAISAATEDGLALDGPRLAPVVVTAGWVALGAVYLVRQFTKASVEAAEVDVHWWTPALVMAALIGYGLALDLLGFVLSSGAFFVACARILGSRRLVRDAVVGLVLALAVYLAFTRLLDIDLPEGVLPL
jgi:putative tricarboxylic transport membrane protein